MKGMEGRMGKQEVPKPGTAEDFARVGEENGLSENEISQLTYTDGEYYLGSKTLVEYLIEKDYGERDNTNMYKR